MTERKHLRVSWECVVKEMRKLAFDAHSFELGISDGEHAKHAYDRYKELRAAKEYLERTMKGE